MTNLNEITLYYLGERVKRGNHLFYYFVNIAGFPNAIKKGMAIAMQKFDEYQLAKWNRNANYKLVDIVNLCHPKVTEAIDKLVEMINSLATSINLFS